MSDMRFIIIGIVLIFSAFMILGAFGQDYQTAIIESKEFTNCHIYSDSLESIPADCQGIIFEMILFIGIVIILITIGIVSLVKGSKGNWDNKTNPEDMVGSSNNKNSD